MSCVSPGNFEYVPVTGGLQRSPSGEAITLTLEDNFTMRQVVSTVRDEGMVCQFFVSTGTRIGKVSVSTSEDVWWQQ